MKGVIRPKAKVLSARSLVPDRNLIVPPPNQFTHVVTRRQAYYYLTKAESASPDGEFPAGTKVVLLGCEGDKYCRVVDGHGLHAQTEYATLKKLRQSPRSTKKVKAGRRRTE